MIFSKRTLFSLFFLLTITTVPLTIQANTTVRSVQEVNEDSLRKLLTTYKQKLANDQNNSAVMIKLASLFFQLDESDSAEIWLKISEAIDDKNPQIYFWKGRIFLKKGKFGIIPIEKLLALLKQDNTSKAIKNFNKAIELQPDYLEARYYLGKAHIQKGGNSHFEDAVLTYQYILSLDNDFLDTRYQLGIAFHKLKNYPEAISSYNTYYNQHPEDARPFIELSRIYFEMDNPRKASKYFMEGVVKLRDKDMLEELFLELRDIASKEEKQEYANTPLEKKGYFFQKFWKSRDPTPITEENERFTEHFKRVMFAQQTYQSVIPPYYDDRGRIYVKYGKPDERYVSNMSSMGTRDNESWSYEKSIQKGLVFDFMNLGGVYQLVQDLTEAAPVGMGYDRRLQLAFQMYNDRASALGGIYNRFSIATEQNYLSDFVNEKISAVQTAPIEVYHHDYKKQFLPFQIRFAQFKGQQNRTRFEIYHSVFSRYLHFEPYMGDEIRSYLLVSAVIYDTLYNELDKFHYSSNFVLPGKNRIPHSANIDQMAFLLNPGQNYHIVFQIENPEGNTLGIGKWNIATRDFSSDSLSLSDIELATKIEDAQKQDQFYKNGLKVVPYTLNRYNLRTPLKFYYEIYNLSRDDDGKTNYQIDYKLTNLTKNESKLKKIFSAIGGLFKKGEKESVASSFTKEGTSTEANEYISIDIQNMPSGISELSVIVTDLVAKKTASSTLKLEFIKSGD